MKNIYFLILGFLSFTSFSQNYCDCDSIKGKKTFTDFCVEYLNTTLKTVPKKDAQFKTIVYYYQGSKSLLSPILHLFKGDKLFFNGSEVKPSTEIVLLNGLYEVHDKNDVMYNQYLFEKGFTKKMVSTYDIKTHAKNKGNKLNSIFEFDYSYKPFKVHRIDFNRDGTEYSNVFQTPTETVWQDTYTKETMSQNPLEFKGVPQDK